MLARLQQGVVATLLALAVAWGFWSRGQPGWLVVAGLLLIGMAHAVVLAFEFLLMHAVNRGDPAPRARPWSLVRAWWAESLVALRVFGWQQPFRSHAWPDRLDATPGSAPARRGVVFLHGFVCNRGLWNGWLRRLDREGRVFVALDLEPVFGSIDDYAGQIDAAVRRVTQATGVPPLVLCHSMGGLAIRAWLRSCQGDARVFHIVTLGTPHHGTWPARIGLGFNARQMRLDSRWLAEVRSDEPAARAALFTCYYSNCDNIVFPASSAALAGARNIHLAGVAHVAMVLEPRVMDDVLALLDAPPG